MTRLEDLKAIRIYICNLMRNDSRHVEESGRTPAETLAVECAFDNNHYLEIYSINRGLMK